jgi:glycosyltransferase involved in cell wall biosynthesis
MFNQGNGHPNGPDVSNLSSIPRPIIGYVGGLHRFVDFNLLIEMARLRPAWSWVFVGPIQTSIGELARLPNVHLLGPQPHERLRYYLRNFDTCLVPYLKNSATATIVPTKVNEYLAAGKPVVSTELVTICDFNEQHRVLLTAPSTPDYFLRAIDESLRLPINSETAAHRTGVAKLNDWRVHLEKMSALIQDAAKKH